MSGKKIDGPLALMLCMLAIVLAPIGMVAAGYIELMIMDQEPNLGEILEVATLAFQAMWLCGCIAVLFFIPPAADWTNWNRWRSWWSE
ncbi:MAG: hypothetical protein AAF358_13560 [Pseudomonadota bacterium]